MPCRSDYMEPSEAEVNRKITSELIVFVNNKIGVKTPDVIVEASKSYYGAGVELDNVVSILCKKLSNFTNKQKAEIIYNAKNKMSRRLADWWEDHLEADKKRLKQEMALAKTAKAKRSAIAKLTKHERKLLGL